MDVLVSLNGMLIKGLGCGLRCKDHLQLQNVPLEMSVIGGQTRQLCWPADAPLQHFNCRLVWFGQLNFHNPAARIQKRTATIFQNIMGTGRAKQIYKNKDKG